MKKTFFIIILFLSTHFTFAQIVEGKNYKGVIFPSEQKLRYNDTVTRWTPTELDIQVLELKLKEFMSNQKKKNLINQGGKQPIIAHNLEKYIRQYAGYISSKGEKMIYVNCFWFEKDDPFSKGWEKKLIQVFDGGSYYWQIHYDVVKQTFIGYAVNGIG